MDLSLHIALLQAFLISSFQINSRPQRNAISAKRKLAKYDMYEKSHKTDTNRL
jgi:hypothetical protein